MSEASREIRLALSELTTSQLIAAVREKLDDTFDRKFDNLTDQVSEIGRDVAVLKKQMEQLLGNGQPGFLKELREQVSSHSDWINGQEGERRATRRHTIMLSSGLSLVLTLLLEGAKYLLTKHP
jgi:copper homeostasis protein CutC